MLDFSQTDMRALVAAQRPDLLDAACELVGEDPFPRVEESAGPGRVLSKLAPRCIEGASAGTAETFLEDISVSAPV